MTRAPPAAPPRTTRGGPATLKIGHRYGAGVMLDRWALPRGEALVLLQIGGYISF